MKTSTRIAVVVLAGIGLTACSDAATTSGSAVTTTTTTAPAPTATTAAAAPTTTTAPKPTGVYPLGTTVKVPVTIDGIASALVTAVYPNATSQSQFDTPDAGTTYFAADATECAGSKGSSTGADPDDFSLLLSNGSTAMSTIVEGPVTQIPTLSQLGGGSTSLAPDQCDRGFIVWQVPTGTTATYVQFSGTSASFSDADSVVKWPAS